MKSNDYSTWLEIDLGAIRNNVQQLRTIAQTRVMAVVKANGYGHGAQAVAQAAEAAGAAWCGVARLDEALALRRAGIACRILVLGYTPPGRVPEALTHNITLTVYDPQTTHEYVARAAAYGQNVRLHIKVETGMGRLGIPPEETVEFLRTFASHTGVEIEGIFTHFARADEPGADTTRQQLARFQNALTALDAAGLRPALVHAANSAATLRFPAARFDMVRAGIALYGLPPAEECPLPAELQAALTWKARLTSVKQLAPGHGVSYGHRYFTQGGEQIGVVPIGYADGFRRVAGNELLVGGRRAPVVGTVCMDQIMIRLDAATPIRAGAEVIVLGSQGEQAIPAQEIARRWGTISYEVVCGLAARLPRVYLNP